MVFLQITRADIQTCLAILQCKLLQIDMRFLFFQYDLFNRKSKIHAMQILHSSSFSPVAKLKN